jgi:hypothetical protein
VTTVAVLHDVGITAVMLGGQTIVGGCVSLTVTLKAQRAVLPEASLTVQLTVVVPFGKTVLDDGVQTGTPAPAQLSVAVALG